MLGAGFIATFHSKMLRAATVGQPAGASPLIERAGVFDPDTERAKAFAAASGHRWCATEAEVLDTCDAVYICTWTSEHRRLVAEAAARGLAIFCEKPLGTDLDDAEAIAAIVRDAGVINQVGLILRRSPAYLWARHLLEDPGAGAPMAVIFRDDQFIPIQGHYRSNWRAEVERAGSGTLLEHSIHDVDMLTFLLGQATEVAAMQSFFHRIDGIEDVVSAVLRFDNGATATLTSIWHDMLHRPSQRRVEIFCERRQITIAGDDWFGPVSWSNADDDQVHELAGEELVAATAPMAEPLGGHHPDLAFVHAVIEGRPASPDMEVALEAHRLIDRIYRATQHAS